MIKKKKIASDFDRIYSSYFKEIGDFSPLSKEEETSLWEQYKKNNDLSARDKIIKSNLKFVANVAKPYIGKGLSYADLIAEGNYGLMKAMEKFDYTKGFKTISYSVWWIKQAIREAILERNGLYGEDLPTDSEAPLDNDEETSYIENATPNEYIENLDIEGKEKIEALSMLLDCLTKRERDIIKKYYGIDGESITLEEIGNSLNLTKERVRQIKEKALKKLRSEALNNSINCDIYI